MQLNGNRNGRNPIVVALLLAAVTGTPAAADVFNLTNGGKIQGEWLNRDERPLSAYVVQVLDGGRITLPADQVQDVQRQRPEEIEYARIAPTFADSIDQQWQLAEWCRERQLTQQRGAHLRRIIELEPDHPRARHGLGYAQFNGQWILREQWREDEGYVLYQGRWRTPQDIQLLEARRKKDLAERAWLADLKRLRTQLETPKVNEAREKILAIRDPLAVRALKENLAKERFRAVKLLYVEALGQIADRAAVVTLLETSLNDPDVEVFHACADELVRLEARVAVDGYIKGLKDANNVRVNRSAQVLARLDAQDAFVPLINALITTHVVVEQPSRASSGDAISTTFVSPANDAARQILPSGGHSVNTGGTARAYPVRVPNQDVLAALAQLSGGVTFGYNQKAWSAWHASNRGQAHTIEARAN